MERKGDTFYSYVNGILISRNDNIKLAGNGLGISGGKGTISIYRYSVYQNNNGIQLPANLNNKYKREYLPKTINNGKPVVSLHMAPDGSSLFVNVRDKEDKNNPDVYGCDDIYQSTLLASGGWSTLNRLPEPINSVNSNDIISISADNNTYLMGDTACTATKSICFFTTHRTTDGWSAIKKMPMRDSYNLSPYNNSVLSADGKTIVCSFTMKDSKGPSDIYVSHLLPDSTWSKAVNMGNTINTLGSDLPCYIASDNKTFYFATDGRLGYGEMDIYVSRRLDDTWLNWSEPENLGLSINTDGWDAYFTMDAKGEYGYYTSMSNDSKVPSGFYKIQLSKEIKASPVVVVKGKVLNAKTQTPINATLYYEILPEGKEAGVARSNPKTGEYKLILPYGKQYGYRAEAKGYITVNENFDLVDEKDYIELEKDLLLAPIEVGQTIKLNNIFFVQSKSELLSSSYPELNRLAAILKDNPSISIELRGYTDNIGDPKKNILLSEDRVNVVRAYLIKRGIAAIRITGKGMGGVNPVTTDTSEEARKMNRRVEFVILSK